MSQAETKEVTLRDVASDVRAWADTLDGIDEDDPQREEALVAATQALTAGVAKVEAFGKFLKRCKAEAEFLRSESSRLHARALAIESLEEKLKLYALGVLDANQLKRLEGQTLHIRSQKSPDSVEVTDEVAVPAAYKVLTITITAGDWELHLKEHLAALQMLQDFTDEPLTVDKLPVVNNIRKTECEIAKTPLKVALERGPVAGARLVSDRKHLRIG